MSGKPRAHIRIVLPDTSWAYAAGLIDGEGYVGRITNRSGAPQLRIAISQVDPPVIDWLEENIGGLRYWREPYKNIDNGRHTWIVTARFHVLDILRNTIPYLTLKKERAQELVNLYE